MLPEQTPDVATKHESIVAVFDTRTMALRAIEELRAAEFDDIWLSVVRGETDDGETVVADGETEELLYEALARRGTPEALVHHYDGILPPSSAIVSVRARSDVDRAIFIIEVAGGHIDHD